jgi:hypothetical protein
MFLWGLLAGLIVGYIVFIGPLDVKRWITKLLSSVQKAF